MAEGKKTDLGLDPIPRLMLRLAIPSIIAQTINMLYNIVDRIYIGNIPGVGAFALTGVGLTFPVITLITAFSALFGSGGAPLASIKLGEGRSDKAEEILGSSAFMLMISAALIVAFFSATMKPILMLFGASENTIGFAADYLSVYLLGTFFVQWVLGLNPFITAQGRAATAMGSVVIGAVLNIVLDPIFIFVLNMGVRGAALATVISQGASFLWVVRFLTGSDSQIRLRRDSLRFRGKVLAETVALGISPFMMIFTESAIQVVLNSGMMRYGNDYYVGTMTIIISIVQLFTLPINGYTQGVQPIMSFNYGAGNLDRVRRCFRLLLFSALMLTAVSFTTVELLPRPFIRLFTSDDQLIELTVKGIRIYVFGHIIFGLQSAIQTMFVALGQAKISLFIAVLRKVILLIPLALILPVFIGVNGVYLAEPIADILSVTTATTLMLLNFRRILEKRASSLQNRNETRA